MKEAANRGGLPAVVPMPANADARSLKSI
jgi:hypothetical protein